MHLIHALAPGYASMTASLNAFVAWLHSWGFYLPNVNLTV